MNRFWLDTEEGGQKGIGTGVSTKLHLSNIVNCKLKN